MTFDHLLTSTVAQYISLLLLRITTGFLLVWVGLDKIVSGKAPFQVARNFELDAATGAILGYTFGGVQLVIGTLCVIGLWRRIVLPLQAAILGSTAVSVWWAIIDPFRWYITGVDRIVFNSHVFYSTSITFAACILLISFRHHDAFALDRWRHDAPKSRGAD